MKVGKTIKMLRVKKGYTQKYFANLLEITPSYLSLIESGDRKINMEFLEKISQKLEIPTSVFVLLASEKSDLEGIDNKLYEKLSTLAIDLIREKDGNKSNL
ncbi:MAG: helix-turn-helix transcriptional regulator [Candidatus Methanofastidiosa archaeon]|nr:helix-turn-helix transcriptional regulator [Candidatus Methanofastidiosa archaeon]